MINKKTFQLRKNLTVTIQELTVADIMEIMWLMGDFAYPSEFELFIQKNKLDVLRKASEVVYFTPHCDFSKLKETELKKVIELFAEVNDTLFNNGNNTEQHSRSGFAEYKEMSATVNALVRLKHTDVLNYPFSLMLEISESLKKEVENG